MKIIAVFSSLRIRAMRTFTIENPPNPPFSKGGFQSKPFSQMGTSPFEKGGLRGIFRRLNLRGLSTSALLFTSTLASASTNIPPPPQSTPLLLSGATLHTVSGASIPNGDLLIDKGKIAAIGAVGSINAPAIVQRIDLKGKQIYPGFITANTAMGLTEISAVRATLDQVETGTNNPNSRAIVAVNADSEIIPVTRANGVLAALSVPRAGFAGGIGGTSALIQLDGWTWEEMALVPEVALHVTLPTMRRGGWDDEGDAVEAESLRDERRRFVERRLLELDQAFEAAAAYLRARRADPATPRHPRWEALRPVLEGGRPVFVHADELPQIRHALGLAARHGLRLVIVGGADAWRVAPLLRERGVAVIVAGVHREPRRRDEDVDRPFRLPALLAEAGVRFAIARGGGGYAAANERNLPYEAATAAAHGLPREEALRAITLYPAQILGVGALLGSLAPGRLASFIVTDGDPLETTTRIERLFVQGREVSADNRQERLVRKYRERLR